MAVATATEQNLFAVARSQQLITAIILTVLQFGDCRNFPGLNSFVYL
jgi:hypothetical protein